jgi:hypothetical protein
VLFHNCVSRISIASIVGVTPLLACAPAPQRTYGSARDPVLTPVLSEQLALREYGASNSADALQAPNRRHDFRTWFERDGIRVVERGAMARELVSLRLAGIGRGAALHSLGEGELSNAGSRVELRREGVVEWFSNSPAGLEHGFEIAEAPKGDGALAIELRVADARALLDGAAVKLRSESGRELRYANLAVVDATGRALASRFSVPDAARIRMEIADAGATYPIMVDPHLFGVGSEIALGPGLSGLSTMLAPAGDIDGDGFDDVALGVPYFASGQTNEGAVFLFRGSATGIADGDLSSAATRIESDQANAFFGQTLAGAGDVNGDGYDDLIVGAQSYDLAQIDEGAAFLFLGSATGSRAGTSAGLRRRSRESRSSAIRALPTSLGTSTPRAMSTATGSMTYSWVQRGTRCSRVV